MARPGVATLLKRVQEAEIRSNPPKPRKTVCLVTDLGEDSDLAINAWKAEHPDQPADFFIIRVIVGRLPDPARCTRQSIAEAVPQMKLLLAGWSECGPSEAVTRTASHWQGLCERFGVEA
jgi:hypothetical protein